MVNYADKALFEQTSIDKQFHIYTDDETISITNKDLFLGEFTLNESLCSEESLQIGTCEASSVMFTAANNFGSLKGKWLNIEIELAGAEEPFFLGRYKVFSDKPTSHKARREVVAYDALYDVLNADMSEWYANLWDSQTSTMTVKQFRDAFFSEVGIIQESITLLNDNFIIQNAVDTGNTLSGKTILNSICEFNGVFGHIGRDGMFHYLSLESLPTYAIANSQQIESDYEEFTTKEIDAIYVYSSNGSLVVKVGEQSPTNVYTIKENIMIYNQDISVLTTVVSNLLAKIDSISYRPFSGEFNGNPCYEVGDKISFSNGSGTIVTLLLERTLRGIQSLRDSYSANGTETYQIDANSASALKSNLLKQLNDLRSLEKTSMQTYIFRNYERIIVDDSEPEELISFEYVTVDTSAIVFDIQICLEVETAFLDGGTSDEYDYYNDAVGKVTYLIDGIDYSEYPAETWQDGKHILTLHLAFPSITVNRHYFSLYLNMQGGKATINIGDIYLIMSGNGLLPTSGWDGTITANEEIQLQRFSGYIGDFSDSAECNLVSVTKSEPADTIPLFRFNGYLSQTIVESVQNETDLMIFTTTVNLEYLTYTATITNGKFMNGEVILPKMGYVLGNRVHGSNCTFYVSFDDGETWLAYTESDGWTQGASMTIEEFTAIPSSAWQSAPNGIIKAIIVDDAYLQEIDTIGGVPIPPED